MTPQEAVDLLNDKLGKFVVPSGKGVDDFPVGDEYLQLHIVRSHDWNVNTLEGNDHFRLILIIASTEEVPLSGVQAYAFKVPDDSSVWEKGIFKASSTNSREFLAQIRRLPFGGNYRLRLELPESEV